MSNVTFRGFKKLVSRADVEKLTCYQADSWNMISQESEQEENLPPADEQSHESLKHDLRANKRTTIVLFVGFY